MAYNMFATPKMETKPIEVYDPNQGWRGAPSARNIAQAYNTPQAQLQTAQRQNQQQSMPEIKGSESTAGIDYLNSLYTSPEQEEKMRKASVMNQRILAVGDAIRQIGNIANTVNGAPSQKLNNPVAKEQARYEKGKALRDKANLKYATYQQQKAIQDAKAKQWEADFNLKVADAARKAGYTEAQIKNMQERLANQKAYQDQNLALREKFGTAQQKERERHNKEAEKQGRQRIGIASKSAADLQNYRNWKMKNAGGGSGVAPLDTPKGRITPNGKNYSNQLLQMFDYAKSKGYVKESDVAKRLRELGFGKDESDNVKRQMVMDLLRSNQDLGDYASSRLGWSYGDTSGGLSIGWDDDEDDDTGLEIGW